MKHAGPAILDTLEPVLATLRGIDGLRERTRGVFYRGGIAFLHFHEDPAGIFADVKSAEGWRRMRCSTARERIAVVAATRRAAKTFSRG